MQGHLVVRQAIVLHDLAWFVPVGLAVPVRIEEVIICPFAILNFQIVACKPLASRAKRALLQPLYSIFSSYGIYSKGKLLLTNQGQGAETSVSRTRAGLTFLFLVVSLAGPQAPPRAGDRLQHPRVCWRTDQPVSRTQRTLASMLTSLPGFAR